MYPSYKFIIIIIFFHHFPINGKHFSIKVSVNTWPLATADNHYKQRKLVTFCVEKTKKPVMSLHVANKAFLSTWKVTQEMIFPGRLLRHFQKYGPYGLSMAPPSPPLPFLFFYDQLGQGVTWKKELIFIGDKQSISFHKFWAIMNESWENVFHSILIVNFFFFFGAPIKQI